MIPQTDSNFVRILLVEDNPADADLMREEIEASEKGAVSFQMVDTLKGALTRLRGEPFDLILLDLGLPDSKGTATYEKIRQANAEIPIFVLTGLDDPLVGARCLELGAQSYLVKGWGKGAVSAPVLGAVASAAAMRTLQASHENFKEVLDGSVDAILVLQGSGVIRFANRAALALFQGKLPEGQHIGQLWYGHEPQELEIPQEGREAVIVEVRTGHATWCGDPATIVTYRDISERKKTELALRRSEDRLQLAMQATKLGAWDWDLVTGELVGSERYRELHNLPRTGEISVDLVFSLVFPDDVAPIKAFIEQIIQTGQPNPDEMEFRVPAANGEIRWIRSLAQTAFAGDGEAKRAIRRTGAIFDITERKSAEQEILRLNEDLENRVQQRTQELAVANQELEAFSYSISHDLRAPLRAISGYSRMLAKEAGDKLSAESLRLLAVVQSETRRMAQLIEALLTFSRLGKQQMSMQEVEMNTLVQAAIDEAQAANPGCLAAFHLATLPGVWGEPVMLRQVWANLVGNAVKFSRDSAEPQVRIGTTSGVGETVFFVTDNGAGFDMAHAEKLFGVFQRLHGEEEFEGTGVGLAFVRRIVARHGGRVWANSAPGMGAAFYFSLPDKLSP